MTIGLEMLNIPPPIPFDQTSINLASPLNTTPFAGKSNAETYFLHEYPDAAEINTEQKDIYSEPILMTFETALANEDFSGSTRLYENYIDVNSFVDFFILSELSHNADAYRLSTFLYKDRDSKLKMGPLWDLNLTYGNDGDFVSEVVLQYLDISIQHLIYPMIYGWFHFGGRSCCKTLCLNQK